MVDCALITALPSELNALLSQFRYFKTPVVDASVSFYETLTPTGLSLVGAVASGMGQLSAAILASKVIAKYNPKKLILVGIAGGLDSSIPLGDVVISKQIVDYELGKVTNEGFSPRWSVYPCDSDLLNGVHNFRSDNWKRYILSLRPDGKMHQVGFHVGTYLSGNKVIANAEVAGTLKSIWAKASAIDMEAAGIAAVLREIDNPPGFITIKGICDRADSQKNDEWQAYAADAASSFVYSFVCEYLTPQELVSTPMKAVGSDRAANQPSLGGHQLDSRNLRLAIEAAYDMVELKVLCRDLGIAWDEIAGTRLSEKTSELIEYLRRRQRLSALIDLVNRDKNDILRSFVPQ